jgi:hypothetical protein
MAYIASSPNVHAQVLVGQFQAGAQGAARSAWIEINRPLTTLSLGGSTGSIVPVLTAASGGLNTVALGPISLPIGMDIKSITALASDIDAGWLLVNFTFGSLNLVNGQGVGPVNMSMFDPRLEHCDRLAPWILSKTRVDVQVKADLYNACTATPDNGLAVFAVACFHGFALNAFQEEQVCAIQTRVEPTDRNVGVAELIHMQRSILGAGLGLSMPAHFQPSAQVGRSQMATMVPQVHAQMMQPQQNQFGYGPR